ncbi:Ig-like domain-containing protein [Enterococcus sp. LJL51]|uniref:Ig-like domain-containing protein n=1 Tax=Enterococcus sp. LJL51 TaxID=3416656 RepID=UPI003CEB65F1
MKKNCWLGLFCVVIGLFLQPIVGQAGSNQSSDIVYNDGRVVPTDYLMEYEKKIPLETFPSEGNWPVQKSPRQIFGEDDRVVVEDVTQSSYRKIVFLEIKFPKASAEGTGFLVSADTVLTAGHCLYAPDLGGWAQSVNVYLIEEGTENNLYDMGNYKKVTSTTFMVPRGRLEYYTPNYDMGAIKLSEPAGEKNGWFGLTQELPAPYTLSGYHSDGKGKMLTQTVGTLVKESKDTIDYILDSKPVSSGGPIYNPNNQQAMAINVQEYTTKNTGARFNTYHSNGIMSYAFAHYSAFGTPVSVEEISITPEVLQVGVGETEKMAVSITPTNATNKYVKLSSSEPSVASVSDNSLNVGQNESRNILVSGHQPGTTVITAESEDGQRIGQATVTVVPAIPVEQISFVPEKIQVYAGEPTPLTPVVTPENATDKVFIWSVSDSSYGTIDQNGVYTGHRLGRNIITVKVGQGVNQKSAVCEVNTVDPAVTGVKITPEKKELFEGESQQLTAVVIPDFAKNKTVAWSSSNPKIVEVSADGTVKGIKAGTATITATTEDGGKQATSTITVNKVIPVKSVKLEISNKTMIVGTEQRAFSTVSPSNASNPEITYTSSDSAVAEIDKYGRITAKKSGKTTITVLTMDGNKKAAAVITVKEERPVTGIKLTIANKTMIVGTEQQLIPTLTPVNASNQRVSWMSSNSEVATISETGLVQAKNSGKTTITVLTEDGAKKISSVITVQEEIPVKSVKLSIPSKTIMVGEQQQITSVFTPQNASNKKGTWTSSNSAVATVSENGEVAGIKAGRATITFISKDGGKKVTVALTIK